MPLFSSSFTHELEVHSILWNIKSHPSNDISWETEYILPSKLVIRRLKSFQPSDSHNRLFASIYFFRGEQKCGICVPKDIQNTAHSDAWFLSSVSGSSGATTGETLEHSSEQSHYKQQLIRVNIPLLIDSTGGVFEWKFFPFSTPLAASLEWNSFLCSSAWWRLFE